MGKKFTVVKPFNHNVVFCIDREFNKECILIGTGIGFGVKESQIMKYSSRIDKVFYLVDKDNMYKFAGLSKEVDKNIIGVTEEIILMAHSKLNKELDERIHITLTDHIAFTVDRFNNDMSIVNPFLVEIKNLYKEEYKIAVEALKLINERLSIALPEDEVGFIAMHFHAAVNKINVSKTAKNTAIINEVVSFLENKTGKEIDKEGIDYARLITHIRFALDRVDKNIPIKNILLSEIKEKFQKSYDTALEIAEEIKTNFGIILPEDEVGYLAIHIEKIQCV